MSTLKGSLLAGAALIVAAAGAEAADLPTYKAAPVEYMRVCDAFGQGFFYIPGTDTCLRVTGSLRAEYTVRGNAPTGNLYSFARNLSGQVYDRDLTALRARGYLNADVRTQTAYGTIRTFVSFRITRETTNPGPYGGGSYTPTGATFSEKTSAFQGFGSTQTILDKGFIQFAGLTAGRAQSFFDFDAQSHELLTNSMGNSNQTTEMLAYTATFGKGYSATLSIEDRTERALGDNGFLQSNLNPTSTKAGYLAYAGDEIPDIVAALRADQEWGAAQLAAAYHQVSSVPVTLSNGSFRQPGDEAGFAAIAGFKVNVPQIAKGDNFTAQATWEHGALDYINPLNYQPNGLSNIYDHNTSVSTPANDGFILPDGRIGLNRGWAVYAAYQHYWAPEWNSSIFGDYTEVHNPIAAQLIGAGTDNSTIYQVGGNLIWTPVKDLIIGGEVLYSHQSLSGAANLATALTNPDGSKSPLSPEADDVRGRLSLRRAF